MLNSLAINRGTGISFIKSVLNVKIPSLTFWHVIIEVFKSEITARQLMIALHSQVHWFKIIQYLQSIAEYLLQVFYVLRQTPL